MKEVEEARKGLRKKVIEICKQYLKKDSKILDIGCGYGIFTRLALEDGFKCIGIEIDEEKLKHLKENGIKSLCADLNFSLPVKDSSFDCIVGIEVIEHLENPWNVLREVKRVLKKNGIVIFTFPNFTDFLSRLKFFFKTEFSFFIKEIPPYGHITILPYWLFIYIVKKVGFEVIEIKSHRTWIKRLSEKTVKHKLSLILLLPLFLISYFLIKVFRGETNSLLAEDYIFILRKS